MDSRWFLQVCFIVDEIFGTIHTFLMGRYLPTTFCTIYYGLQWMKEERGSSSQHDELLISRASFFHCPELAICCEYAVTDESD